MSTGRHRTGPHPRCPVWNRPVACCCGSNTRGGHIPRGLRQGIRPLRMFEPGIGELGQVLELDEPAFTEPGPETVMGGLEADPGAESDR